MAYGFALVLGGAAFLTYWLYPPNVYSTLSRSRPVGAERVDTNQEGKLISVTGTIECSEPTTDPAFLKPAHYLIVQRWVDIYSRSSHTSSKGRKRYYTEWTPTPSNLDNPDMGLSTKTFFAPSARIGSYSINPSEALLSVEALETRGTNPLKLGPEDLAHDDESARRDLSNLTDAVRLQGILTKKRIVSPDGKYLYLVSKDISAPVIGDFRISFDAIQDGYQATAFGVLKQNQLTRIGPGGMKAWILRGDRNQALADFARQTTMAMLITRAFIFALLNATVFIALLPLFAFSWMEKGPQKPSKSVDVLLAAAACGLVSVSVTVVSLFVYGTRIALLFLCLTAAGMMLFSLARRLLGQRRLPL
jgi:hypothetical protein